MCNFSSSHFHDWFNSDGLTFMMNVIQEIEACDFKNCAFHSPFIIMNTFVPSIRDVSQWNEIIIHYYQ